MWQEFSFFMDVCNLYKLDMALPPNAGMCPPPNNNKGFQIIFKSSGNCYLPSKS